MPKALDERIADAAEKTGLAKQDVMRLSLERGIDVLIAQLNPAVRVVEASAS